MVWVNDVEWDQVHLAENRFWTTSAGDLEANLTLDPKTQQWWVWIEKTGVPAAEICCGIDENEAIERASRHVERTRQIEQSRRDLGYGY
jgi:hypothetical protein